jgi:L-glyceraldehyde 3-phosphate reductase
MIYTPNAKRYSEMVYRRTGNSGLLLPAISLGLWHNFGNVDAYSNYESIVLRAFDKGITHFDLANNYGPPPGSAESNFGKILHTHLLSHRDELIISTKAGYDMWEGPYGEWGSRKYMIASLEQSLKRMNLDYVDIFYSHRYDPNTPLEETMGALAQMVKQGKALYVGVSNYPAKATKEAISILKSLGTPCLIHQPKYSMLERWVEDDLLDLLEDKGVGCIAFSPLAQGLLTNKYLGGIPENSRANKQHGALQSSTITPEILGVIEQLNNVALERGQTLAQMAIAWLLKDNRVTSVLIGASSVTQLDDNLAALNNLGFTDNEMSVIKHILGIE